MHILPAICIPITVLSLLALSLPLYLGGYYYRYYLNQNDLVSTECLVTGHIVTIANYVVNGNNYNTALQYSVNYTVMENKPTIYTTNVTYDYNNDDAMTAYSVLRVNEPIGSSYKCYYSKKNPYSVMSNQYDQHSYLIAAATFTGIGIMACLITVVYFLATRGKRAIDTYNEKRIQRIADDEARLNEARAVAAASRLREFISVKDEPTPPGAPDYRMV